MKERPIIFSGDMVKVILEGRKTQTRRVIKPQPYEFRRGDEAPYPGLYVGDRRWYDPKTNDCTISCKPGGPDGWAKYCPYGQPGDRLWVREVWGFSGLGRVEYKAFPADGRDFRSVNCWRSPIHMAGKFSRLTLEITNVRVERLQEISEEDAKAEGIIFIQRETFPKSNIYRPCAVEYFSALWDSLNKKYPWSSNPWVWVIEFKKQQGRGTISPGKE